MDSRQRAKNKVDDAVDRWTGGPRVVDRRLNQHRIQK